MPIRHPSHLHRNRCGVFGFRLVVPRDLRHVVPGRDHRLSLHTSVLRDAKNLAYKLALVVGAGWEGLRAMTNEDAAEKGKRFMQEMAKERDRLLQRHDVLTKRGEFVQGRMEKLGERFRKLLNLSPESMPELSTSIAIPSELAAIVGSDGSDNTLFDFSVDRLASEIQHLGREHEALRAELAEIAGQSEVWNEKRMAFEALSAQSDQHERKVSDLEDFMAASITKARSQATFVPSPVQMPVELLRQLQQLDVEGGKQPVSQFFEAYCSAHRGEWKDWDRRVKHDYGPVRDVLVAVIGGDLPIEQLTVQHAKRFVDRVRSDVASKGGKGGTAEKKVNRLKAVFRWGQQQALLPDLTGPLTFTAENESYEAFTADELRLMFECPSYSGNSFGRTSRFWLPLLGLYTGARIDELASIELDHFCIEDGVFGVWLSPEGAKTGKNKFSRRFVPMHSALLGCGLHSYLDVLKTERHTFVFPCTPDAARDGRGKAASRDFTAFRQRLGIGSQEGEGRGTKVFHSFRSTLVTALQRAGVPQEVREAISGHARQGTHARVYSQGELPVTVRLEALEKVHFDFVHPRWVDTPAYRSSRRTARAFRGAD